jgi:long-chain-fatty-acid--[acyl-carrier-protein] ligase
MLWLIRWLAWFPFRFLVSLRYWVTIRGKAEVLKHPGPYLLLPNHPAFVDPPNLLLRFFPTFRMRPMLLETNFQNPALAPFAWLIGGIRVPDTDRASAEARERAEEAVKAVIDVLKAGQNVIIWASGRLQRNGVERIGGTRTVADVLAAVPNVTVVLVRTRGLWGSMFSWAWGKKPALAGNLIKGLGLLFCNLLFFTPRRRVTVTMQAFGPADRPEATRDQINPWLEKWFNEDAPQETPSYVPYHFLFGRRNAEFPPPQLAAEINLSKVKPETKQAIAEILEAKLKRKLSENEKVADKSFMDLGLDSLDAMDISLQVEQRFGFTADTIPDKVGDLWALASGLLETAPPKPPPASWFNAIANTRPVDIPGNTIPAAILNQAFANRRQVIVADDLAGAVTYEKLLVGATAMAKRFRDVEGDNIGLLLPASAGCDLAFLGLLLAKKLPVILNWTTGPNNLTHAAEVMKLKCVVTSRAFIDRTQIEVSGTKYLFLEDVRAGIGKIELLRRLLAIRWFPNWKKNQLLKRLPTDPNVPAVLLFTSGSEKAPKAVPLTHDNILALHRGVVSEFNLARTDSILSFLPLFHSFGLVVTTLLPLAGGMRLVHHPDPTDAGALVRKAASYKPTLVAGTPTFLHYMLDRAKPGDLDSLRIIVFGAEKCPEDVFAKAKKVAPQAKIVEGYGITETAAVVAVHRPGNFRTGTLGPPLPGVSICIIDLETDRVLPIGKMGMIHVSGPNVFPGYIDYDGPSPFRELDGKRWYITGDLGELNADGELVFRGRLKRFLKAGGEMISLPALEDPFARMYPPTDQGPRVAVEGVETSNGRRIVLFTTEDLSLSDANARLQQEGFRGVMRIDEVKKVEKIPLLGSGKTDYKVLRKMIEPQ